MKLKIQTEAEKKRNVGLMVKYPTEDNVGKDHKKLEKGYASSTKFSDNLSFTRLGSGRLPDGGILLLCLVS